MTLCLFKNIGTHMEEQGYNYQGERVGKELSTFWEPSQLYFYKIKEGQTRSKEIYEVPKVVKLGLKIIR